MDNIEDQVKEVVAAQFGRSPESINLDTDLIADLNGDSIDLVETLIRADKKFGIKIPEDDFSAYGTKVVDLIQIVTDKLANK